MNKMTLATAALILVGMATQLAAAQTPSPVDAPDQHNASAADADLSDRVRRSIVADRNLSSYAAKIAIVSTDGTVHLTGLVQNDGERAQIESKATAVAGLRHVVDDLRVMSNVADGAGLRAVLEQAARSSQASVPGAVVTAAN